MELPFSASLSYNCSFAGRPSTSKYLPPSFTVIRISKKNKPPAFKCIKLPGARLQQSNLRAMAVVGDATAVLNDSATDHMSINEQSYQRAYHESGEVEDDDSGDEAMVRVSDKLVGVFMVDKPTPTEWRRLLAFSREWNSIRPHFFKRCQDRAENEEDPGMKLSLLRLARKLKEVDEDVQRHNELIEVIRKTPSEIGDIVAKRRKDFTQEFFMHLHAVVSSYHDNPLEQSELDELMSSCLATVQAYDTATKSIEAFNAAELKLLDIFNSPSVNAACRKIDDLAEKNQLDSAMMLMATKAWSAAKETDMNKEEAKDILYHLYMKGREHVQSLVQKETRIATYLLTIEDPEQLLCSLNDAFTPGEELEVDGVDFLYTTPEALHSWIKLVVHAYHLGKEGTLERHAKDLLNPKMIKKLEELGKLIQDKFM